MSPAIGPEDKNFQEIYFRLQEKKSCKLGIRNSINSIRQAGHFNFFTVKFVQ